MQQMIAKLRPGDVVEVKSAAEILQTLDTDGTLDRLPFMPEMIEFCGTRLKVSRRVLKTCYYGTRSGVRKFRTNDVVILDAVRCSGNEHDGCQKACTIFWREAWLRRVEDVDPKIRVEQQGVEQLRARVRTSNGPNRYFCQASEILNATMEFSRWDRIHNCLDEVKAGNCTAFEMAKRIASWLFWRLRRMLLGEYASGSNKRTPVESLTLQPGEWVEVNPVASIAGTLDRKGHNRGLYFTPDMRRLCGECHQVERRLEKIIVDGTGEMRKMHNTVYLKGALCGCIYALGGCPRGEFSYWREIWLRRASCSETGRPSNEHKEASTTKLQ